MTQEQAKSETLSLLQDLGLKEYEARCFMALTQLPTGTAKEISEISEVPRTRVYDAIRILEAQGLVEVQHSSPQRFRAVTIKEAAETLRQKYDARIDTLESRLESLDLPAKSDDAERRQEVWSLTGAEAIQSRTLDLLETADSEIVLLVIEEELLTEGFFERLHEALDRGVSVVLGGKTEAIVSQLESEFPYVEVFETDFSWLMGPERDTEVAISRILFTDREELLIGSFYPEDGHEAPHEQAVFANGLQNGIVVLIRRLLSSGLLSQSPSSR